jgi:hypothetical protein
VPDGFADGLAAHCSFECFEGDADIQFIESTSRVLRPGGHCAILPLYLEHEYFIATSPLCDQHGVRIDADAKRVWRDDEYVVPFSRHYSPEAFVARILAAVPSDMSATVVAFSNIDEVMAVFPRQRIYAFFMLGLQKSKAERAVLV